MFQRIHKPARWSIQRSLLFLRPCGKRALAWVGPYEASCDLTSPCQPKPGCWWHPLHGGPVFATTSWQVFIGQRECMNKLSLVRVQQTKFFPCCLDLKWLNFLKAPEVEPSAHKEASRIFNIWAMNKLKLKLIKSTIRKHSFKYYLAYFLR